MSQFLRYRGSGILVIFLLFLFMTFVMLKEEEGEKTDRFLLWGVACLACVAIPLVAFVWRSDVLMMAKAVKPGIYKVLSPTFHRYDKKHMGTELGPNHHYCWLQEYHVVARFLSREDLNMVVLSEVGKVFQAVLPVEIKVSDVLIRVEIEDTKIAVEDYPSDLYIAVLADTGEYYEGRGVKEILVTQTLTKAIA